MSVRAIVVGFICAATVTLPEYFLRNWFQNVDFNQPVFLLLVTVLAVFAGRMFSRAYDGMADLFIHIHTRYAHENPLRWAWRAVLSLAFYFFGGIVGAEGAAAELSQAFALGARSRSEKWSEQRRRTDVAMVLSAAISAAFQAPFAAIVFCFEIGTGGRALSAIQSGIAAYVGVQFISHKLNLEIEWVDYFNSSPMGEFEWLKILGLAVGGGFLSWGLIRFFRYTQESIVDLFRTHVWVRALCGGVLLAAIRWLYPVASNTPIVELTALLMNKREVSQQAIYFLCESLTLATLLASFGSIGILTPLFMIGSVLGLSILSGTVGVFVGVAAIWAGVLGAPLAAALLTFEMTHNYKLMAVAIAVGVISNEIRKYLKQKPLVHRDLEARGLTLLDGRSASVLKSITVLDAMTQDHEIVYEDELVKDLTDRFINAKHPFLPVVNRQGAYVGLLTLDLLQEGLESAQSSSGFYEVKDLLYKSKVKIKTAHIDQNLADTAGIFGDHPCVAVVSAQSQVVGLLFAYSVRAAYDREVARRTLTQSRDS